jgi:hypothetical protein
MPGWTLVLLNSNFREGIKYQNHNAIATPHRKKITTIEKFFDKMKNKPNSRPTKIIITPFGLNGYEITANHPTAAVLPPHALQLHPK